MQIKYITAFVATLMLGGALAAPVADADRDDRHEKKEKKEKENDHDDGPDMLAVRAAQANRMTQAHKRDYDYDDYLKDFFDECCGRGGFCPKFACDAHAAQRLARRDWDDYFEGFDDFDDCCRWGRCDDDKIQARDCDSRRA